MSSVKLKNAPLKEVIFELHWNCNVDSTTGVLFDSGFDLAQGRFAEQLKPNFPLHKKLLPDGAPLKVFGAPLHQYWQDEFKWPVIQHGQGMITVNEVEAGYQWDTYKTLIIDTVKKLMSSYEDDLSFNNIKLSYIDGYDLDGATANDFMTRNLQTELITKYQPPGNLRGFNLQQRFDLEDASIMELNIANGINNQNQKESVVWTTSVVKQAIMTFDQLTNWIDTAHSVTSDIFKKMLNPDFYASLDG